MSDLSLPQPQSFQVTLPSPSSIAEFWPNSQQFVALPHELQRTISSQVGAIYIGFNLLLSLMNGTCQSLGLSSGLTTFEQYQPFIMDTSHVLWKHFRRWTAGPTKRSFHDEAVTSYLEVLEAVAKSLKPSNITHSGSAKAASTLVRGLCDLLETPDLSVVNQIQFASLLLGLQTTLSSLCKLDSTPERRNIRPPLLAVDDLEAGIGHLCRNEEKFAVLQKDFKVWLCQPHRVV